MKIKLICVGKLKENAYTLLVEEFVKRLTPFAQVKIIEVNDEKIPLNGSRAEETIVRNKEGAKIIKQIKNQEYVVLFDLAGQEMNSIELAAWLEKTASKSGSRLSFVIGGSLGVSEEVIARTNERISISKLTFSHQLMRVIVLEQIYRAYKILNNEPYHK